MEITNWNVLHNLDGREIEMGSFNGSIVRQRKITEEASGVGSNGFRNFFIGEGSFQRIFLSVFKFFWALGGKVHLLGLFDS